MTSQQYYLPYFFDQTKFDSSITKFGLESKIIYNEQSTLAEKLYLIEKRLFGVLSEVKIVAEIPFGETLMIDGDNLVYWNAENDLIEVTKVNLAKVKSDSEVFSTAIDICSLPFGVSVYSNELGLENFVTFVRKSDLKYDLEYFENFVVVIITQNTITLKPFNSFNKLKGDYGYVWPAIAQIDLEKNLLLGRGMRMADFQIDLNQDLY